jgi:hypothetical protein
MEILENPEEITSEDLQKLLKLEEHITVKADNISKLIKNLEGNNLVIKAEIERLTTTHKKNTNTMKALKNYLMDNMQIAQISKIKTDLFNVSIAKNPVSIEILNPDLIDEKYKKYEYTINKAAIKEDFKQDGEIPAGVKVVQNLSLRIK